MKRKSIIGALLLCMTLGFFTTSCEDMLKPDSERHSYTVAQDTLYSYWGILRSLQGIAEKYVILNEARGEFVDASSVVSDTIAAILNFGQGNYANLLKDGTSVYTKAADYYHVINSCNAYIAMCDTNRMTGTDEKYMIKEYAQVQAIRAWVYMQLVYTYGEVPFYTQALLTSDQINDFFKNPSHQMANAGNLADLLVRDLLPMEYVEERYGYPQYNFYQGLVHSSKVMFPVSLVLGDLYLLKGDKASCVQAAQHYYNFLNYRYGGPLSATAYFSYGRLIDGVDDIPYIWDGNPFGETAALNRNQESITCIPSNSGKLDGRVNIDVCRLFGFDATLRSSNYTYEDDGDVKTGVVAFVWLDENVQGAELLPSKGYEALCDSQKYEIYIGDLNDPTASIAVLPGVGDARRAWIMDVTGTQYTAKVGDNTIYGKLISKQNPSGGFSNAYPVVYRKSQVWLRFAEALNRAGFPSYAFAVLKNGLCNNDSWYPDVKLDYEASVKGYYYMNTNETYDLDTIPADYRENPVTDPMALVTLVKDAYIAQGMDETEFDPENIPAFITANGAVDSFAIEYHNYPADYTTVACYYLDRREVEKAAVTPYLNFKTTYFRGTTLARSYDYKTTLTGRTVYRTPSYPVSTQPDQLLTAGVHSRGCGFLRYDERAETGNESYYNYVNMVSKKIWENHKLKVTREDIYGDDPAIREYVVEAVEDLIIDEMGLELAFEGSRFSDLCRVALRRNDPSFLANRVAKRKGTIDPGLQTHLMQTKNWYLPLPKE